MGSTPLTENEKDKIIKMYLDNKSTVYISKQINRSQSCVERFLKKNGYTMNYGSRISRDEIHNIVSLYLNGLTCREIYKKYYSDIYKSEEAIQKIIRKKNVSRGRYVRKTHHNDFYFETIDNEHKAYWLGLLLADGCVIEKENESNIIKLELNNKDRYLVEEFAKDINTNLEVHDYKYERKHNSQIQIRSNKMFKDLSKYGIVPRKTFLINKVPNIDLKLIRHLIRGYFDGDGCAYLFKPHDQNKHRLNITFCGTEAFLIDVKNVLEKENIHYGKIINMNKYGSNVFNLRYGRNESVIKLYEYLYKDSTICLKRKKKKFEIFLDERR
ncbi:LAGLIDADG family homing endonuclease [Faecalibacillus intestinalis]|uniref:LAGLIDADG family homing endonuclease n=1 Tax=Faecalibacillus intestinalis TaxID=1982626 RepID=UPI002E7901D5|nr:LAGLIDADG family homing endonuclease [Faecalibacillus intestinalis]MEE1447971.1 LAGLIDADG family homing endonuclease [Faecalibacillus intestinalis]